jgi:hypothetical protein
MVGFESGESSISPPFVHTTAGSWYHDLGAPEIILVIIVMFFFFGASKIPDLM